MEQGPVPPEPRLSADDTRPDPLDERMASTPLYERLAVIVDYFTPATCSGSLEWIADLAVRASRYELSSRRSARRPRTSPGWHASLSTVPR